ncbi:DNA replication and repair protein RecF [Ensifer adhaerens]|nr:DNA replication and repair protein RecF [Ensifer adhaerens]
MKITELDIKGLGGIDALRLSFSSQMNIICGPNGVGKSTILDAIAHSFAGGQSTLKRNVNAPQANVVISYMHNGESHRAEQRIVEFEPQRYDSVYNQSDSVNYLIIFKTNRVFPYVALDSISKDPDTPIHVVWESNKSGVNYGYTKNWFVNRYLYSAYPEAINEVQRANFELAKECFSALDDTFYFSKVDASSNEIMIKTPSGEIYYEYLSSGFKSCLSIMFAIIREVEFRFGKQRVPAREFGGVILIDELELHLHPIWQSRIAQVLTATFPKAQFIVTTHSPHIIQSADPDQIKVLERRDGEIKERQIPTSRYGFKNWTLDEVLTDVMGMDDTRSDTFMKLIADFESALDREDQKEAQRIFTELDLSLHPNNHTRKLLKLQLSAILDETL